MANFRIQSWKYGLDTRRSLVTSQPGTLAQAVNCHVNQGAEMEKRKAFIRLGLPDGTLGLQATIKGFVVFGSGATPASLATYPSFNSTWGQNVPPLSYMALATPTELGGATITAIVFSTVYKGLPFCLAKFNDAKNTVLAFWNGVLVPDFLAGQVITGYTSTAQQAANLAALINATSNYTAVATNNIVKITGVNGNNFTALPGQNSANGTIQVQQNNTGIPAIAASAAIGSFVIQAGSFGTGTPPTVSAVYANGTGVGGFQLLQAAVVWTGDTVSMATAIATSINLAVSANSGFTAVANGSTVQVYAPPGTTANGYTIEVDATASSGLDGAVCVGNCVYLFTDGTIDITSVQVGALGKWTPVGGHFLRASYGSLPAYLAALATALMTAYPFGNIGRVPSVLAAAVGNNLYLSFNTDVNTQPNTAVTVTYTASAGGTISGKSSLSATIQLSYEFTSRYGPTNPAATAIPANGNTPFTYVWTCSNPNILLANSTSATVLMSTIQLANQGGQLTCVVTDTTMQTSQASIGVVVKGTA